MSGIPMTHQLRDTITNQLIYLTTIDRSRPSTTLAMNTSSGRASHEAFPLATDRRRADFTTIWPVHMHLPLIHSPGCIYLTQMACRSQGTPTNWILRAQEPGL